MPAFTIVGVVAGVRASASWSDGVLTGDAEILTRAELWLEDGSPPVVLAAPGVERPPTLGDPEVAFRLVESLFDGIASVERDFDLPVYEVPPGAVA